MGRIGSGSGYQPRQEVGHGASGHSDCQADSLVTYRRSIILASAIEIESDLFWTSLTGDGYRLFLHPRIRAARLLQAKDERLPGIDDADVGFVVAALKRAVGANKAGKKRKRKVVEVDSGDEESS